MKVTTTRATGWVAELDKTYTAGSRRVYQDVCWVDGKSH